VRQHTLRLIWLAILIVVLAACTGSKQSARSGPTSLNPPQTATVRVSPSPADRRAAEHAILKLTDVGSGFVQTPYQPTAQSERDEAALNRCIGRPSATDRQTAVVYSMQFSKGDSEKILASITFVDTDTSAQEDTAALQGARGQACTKQSFLQQIAEAGDTATATIEPLTPSPTGDATSANYRILAQVMAGPETLPFIMDIVQVIKGRAEVSASFQDVNGSVPASLERHVMTVMLEKL
jgi:hypothetical protein